MRLKWYNGKVIYDNTHVSKWEGHIGKNTDNMIIACTPDGRKIDRGYLLCDDNSCFYEVNPKLGFELDTQGRLIKSEAARIVKFARANSLQSDGETPKVETGLQNTIKSRADMLIENAIIAARQIISDLEAARAEIKDSKE